MEKKRWRVHDSPKILGVILLGCLALSLIGSTFAFYQQSNQLKNPFSVGKAEVAVKENFNPTDEWLPGEEKQKEVWFENQGDMDMFLRFTLDVKWEDKNGKLMKPSPSADSIILNWMSLNAQENAPDGWVKIGNYYYYNKILKAGAATDKTLKSVTFSEELSNDMHNVDYSGTKCIITVNAETILPDENAALTEWNVNATVENPGMETETVTWK